jgi:hypothetical protein
MPALSMAERRTRAFHLSLSPEVAAHDDELLAMARDADVRAVWLAGFFYGHRPYSSDLLRRALQRVERTGMEAHLLNVPLGHPGDSLGAKDGEFPLTPPMHWKLGQRPDGKVFAGTSLHPPATDENSDALRTLRPLGFRRCFLDDDFRLARSPGEIGGCFCAQHREKFLKHGGYTSAQWAELLGDVNERRLTRLLRSWVNWQCDTLTASFRAQRHAFHGELGIMVMYLGAEKAGIRLKDYHGAPLRVGELMFDDDSFGPVKGKTDELFSVLFHRRFIEPELAFSETTAYPADRLSAVNMAAKLVISTLADVRTTMFMSGLTPFPRTHWPVLGPAMREQARRHAQIAGHKPRGPFKHFWGEASRLVGDDKPFSLWLAIGVPFEVVQQPAKEGWTFVSDFDALGLAPQVGKLRGKIVCRPAVNLRSPQVERVGESLAELFQFKQLVAARLQNVPCVVEDEPVVCAWYPSAHRVLLWNLSEQTKNLTVSYRGQRRPLSLEALEAKILDGFGA